MRAPGQRPRLGRSGSRRARRDQVHDGTARRSSLRASCDEPPPPGGLPGRGARMKPTIVLVHGAYAESSSWNDVIRPLLDQGHRVIAWATPLRGLASDAVALTDL